jgi:exopolyphosphatase/pppGpp-phosphohydrolase
MASVAVLDIGSNSIKILVAARDAHGHVVPRFQQALDVRISAGINATPPRLSPEGMTAGLAAIQQLLAAAAPHSPERAILVATSAVRDAANGGEFCDRVRQATGFEIRILTGDEEANAIGRGLTCDPRPRRPAGFLSLRPRRRQPRVPRLPGPPRGPRLQPPARLRPPDREIRDRPRHCADR